MATMTFEEFQATGRELIQTSYVYPPIPQRDFDWCAYRDPERLPYGWGKTEAEAIADLIDNEDNEQ